MPVTCGRNVVALKMSCWGLVSAITGASLAMFVAGQACVLWTLCCWFVDFFLGTSWCYSCSKSDYACNLMMLCCLFEDVVFRTS